MKAGLVGPSYQQSDVTFDAQRSIGFWLVMDQFAKEPAQLRSVPGNKTFSECPFGVGRGVFTASNGRQFSVVGVNICETFANGNNVVRGTFPESTGYVTFADNGFQLAVCDGQRLFILTFATNAWKQVIGGLQYCTNGDFASGAGWTTGAGWVIGTGVATATTSSAALSRTSAFTLTPATAYTVTYTITRTAGSVQPRLGGTLGVSRTTAGTFTETITTNATDQLIEFVGTGFSGTIDNISVQDKSAGFVTASSVAYLDGYFLISRAPTSGIWQISGLYNGLNWAALDFATAESSPDNLLRVMAVSGQVWLVGTETTEIWGNTGSLGFPFQRLTGAKIELGAVGTFSMMELDNSLFWVSKNKQGFGMVFRAEGFSPEKISTETIETAIQKAPTPDTLKVCGYQEEGHTFFMITGGGMETAFVFDLATRLWHERAFLNEYGRPEQPRVNDISFAFGKHICSNRTNNGKIYHQSLDYVDDDGEELLRERIFTHIFNEKKRMQFPFLVVDFEVGVGNNTDPGKDPLCVLSWSNDGAKTWSNGRIQSIGKMGNYLKRVIFWKLGQARQRTYKLRVTSKCKIRISGAYFDG